MDFPIHIDIIYNNDTTSLGLSILYFRSHWSKFLKYDNIIVLFLKVLFILAYNADPDEMFAAFQLGLHCLSKYLFTGIQNEKE